MPTALTGFLTAVAAAIAFGSFAVPIKSPAVVKAKVHPVIFQSYKSLACFAVSCFVPIWAKFRLTWWGLLAAAIWVNTGLSAIIAIHLCGLGVAQSVWSGISIVVSFLWGKLFFKEPMEDAPMTITGVTLMIVGMVGLGSVASLGDTSSEFFQEAEADVEGPELRSGDSEMQRLNLSPDSAASLEGHTQDSEAKLVPQAPFANRFWLRHQFCLGVITACYVGLCAGTMLVCLKLAPPDCKGNQYQLSFGLGVGAVNVVILAAYFLACQLLGRTAARLQVKVAAGPGCLAGLLWTLGNYASIFAVDQLGIAVGFPIVQCNLIISNVWALFYYKEVQGRYPILCFFISTFVIILGVCLLASFGL